MELIYIARRDIFIQYFKDVKKLPLKWGHRSSKYIVFVNFDGQYIFIGKSGAIRVGKTISDSVSMTDLWGPRILKIMEKYNK